MMDFYYYCGWLHWLSWSTTRRSREGICDSQDELLTLHNKGLDKHLSNVILDVVHAHPYIDIKGVDGILNDRDTIYTVMTLARCGYIVIGCEGLTIPWKVQKLFKLSE